MDSAWIAAIFGLVGVVVGGLLNAATTAWSDRRRGASATRAASRLVRNELRFIGAHLAASSRAGVYGPEADEPLPRGQWEQHSGQLAASLDDDLWESVSMAHAMVASLEVSMSMHATPPVKSDRLPAGEVALYSGSLEIVATAETKLQTFLLD
jgi:hypothetical protein